MKVAVIGLSGAGKSTLARQLGEKYEVPVLHLDSVHFLSGWVERPLADEQRIVGDFLDSHDGWVIDGNYSGAHLKRRLDEADAIYILLVPRLVRLARIAGRWWRYCGQSRPSMTPGNNEKLDLDFVKWILWQGCTPARMRSYRRVAATYPDKTRVYRWWREI